MALNEYVRNSYEIVTLHGLNQSPKKEILFETNVQESRINRISRPALLPAEQPPKNINEINIPENFLANLLLKHAFYLEFFTLPDMTSCLKLNSAITLHLSIIYVGKNILKFEGRQV